jgi:hypothetical protein
MKRLSFFLFALMCLSQIKAGNCFQQKQLSDTASFTATVNIHNATKDGIYINGYVVNIDYPTAKSLNGKKVKISGKVTVVKAAQNTPVEQGRAKDTKHIEHPLVTIVEK